MDACDMTFENSSIDFIFDKACLDSIICSENASQKAMSYVKEINRVLKDKGRYFCVSYGIPDYRCQYFENEEYSWLPEVKKI